MITKAEIGGISPFFIVKDAPASFSFYRDQLGFEITFQGPGENPFFGIVDRGGAMIMLKDVGVDPLPNHKREPMARWDAWLCASPKGGTTYFPERSITESTRSGFLEVSFPPTT